MSVQTPGNAPSEAMSSALTTRVQQAIDALDRALGEPPSALTQDVDVAERAIAEARDELIRDLRQPSLGSDTSGRRRNLNELNVALSLVVGVEYPAAGIQRKLLEQARDLLRDLLGEHSVIRPRRRAGTTFEPDRYGRARRCDERLR